AELRVTATRRGWRGDDAAVGRCTRVPGTAGDASEPSSGRGRSRLSRPLPLRPCAPGSPREARGSARRARLGKTAGSGEPASTSATLRGAARGNLLLLLAGGGAREIGRAHV